MSLISTIITNTSPPNFVLRRKLSPSKVPNSGAQFAPLPKRKIPSDTLTRNRAPVLCSAAVTTTVERTVSLTSIDEATAAVAGEHPKESLWGRDWTTLDVGRAGGFLALHGLSLLAPFYFTWDALWVASGLYLATGWFGIALSYHRHLSHQSFKLPKWLEYTFAYLGAHALQGDPIDWVNTHWYHHKHTDQDGDPHTPIHGFWFSHTNWLFNQNSYQRKCGGPTKVEHMHRQPFYKFMQKTYLFHHLGLALLLYSCGGLPYLVWGMGVRTVCVLHMTWFVASACHIWGDQVWDTKDLSKNNRWIGVLGFGEGWHNNHHAFVYSARHGLEWWQIDLTWYAIRFLEAVGLATDVKLPTEFHKKAMALKPDH